MEEEQEVLQEPGYEDGPGGTRHTVAATSKVSSRWLLSNAAAGSIIGRGGATISGEALPFCTWQPRSSRNPRQAGCQRVAAGSWAEHVQIKPFKIHSMNRTLAGAQVLCRPALAGQHAFRFSARCAVCTACRHHKGAYAHACDMPDARLWWDHTLSSCVQAEGTHPQISLCSRRAVLQLPCGKVAFLGGPITATCRRDCIAWSFCRLAEKCLTTICMPSSLALEPTLQSQGQGLPGCCCMTECLSCQLVICCLS